MKYEKIYVSVGLKVDTEGDKIPVAILWSDGKVYGIDKIKYKTPATSLKVGGRGIRYTVMIDGKERYLFDEDGRWFVEGKVLK